MSDWEKVRSSEEEERKAERKWPIALTLTGLLLSTLSGDELNPKQGGVAAKSVIGGRPMPLPCSSIPV